MKRHLFLSCFCVFASLYYPLASFSQINDGMIGYWPFNGNANDESGYHHNGEVIGAELTSGKNNAANTAYALSSQKYIDLGDLAAFDFGNDAFTVSAWINKSHANSNWSTAFIGKWNNGGIAGSNEWILTSGGDSNDIPNFTIEVGNVRYAAINTEALALDTWYHLTAVRRPGSIELYVNGELKSSIEVPNLPVNNVGRNLFFGKFGGVNGSGTYFNRGAKIDDVKIFNRALSPQEIMALYGGPPEGAVPDEVEYQALVDLYNSTNGINWTEKSNWLQGTTIADMAAWYGITVANGDISEIWLSVNNLEGEIPSSLGNLIKLQYLMLGSNNLSGTIPASLGNLNDLVKLYLNNNNLTGEIPVSVGELTSLTYLYLQLNGLGGTIPGSIGNLKKLQRLYLFDNHLTGTIPFALGELQEMTHLSLYNNSLTGSIPESIGNLTKLLSVNISSNALTGPIPASITSLTALKTLSLNYNNLSGSLPLNLGDLSSLEVLYLRGNDISGAIPESIGELSNLRNLMIDGNPFTGNLPESLGNCTKLIYLYLHNTDLSGSIPSSLGNLKSLARLYVYNTQISGSIPNSLGEMTNLVHLFIHNNKLTGTLPSSFGNLKKLKTLQVSSNLLEGALPESLVGLDNALTIYLHGNQFISFPDFTNHQSPQDIRITASYNNFNFQGLEKNFTGPSTHIFSSFSYSPQSPLPPQTVEVVEGESLSFTGNDNALHNHYQWQKNNDGTWTDIAGATTKAYMVLTPAGGDIFRCKITNDWVTGMTLFSRSFTVKVKERLVAQPPGDLVQNRPTNERVP